MRTTRIVRRLQHAMSEGKENSLFICKKSRGGLITACSFLVGQCREDGAKFSLELYMGRNEHKWAQVGAY